MKAIIYEKYGAPDVLQLKEIEKPTINNNEILIRNFATSVTSGDGRLRKAQPFIARLFTGLFKPKRWPILGVTFAGVIESVGADVTAWKTEDRVFGANDNGMGCYAEYLKVKVNCPMVKIPDNVSFEEAAATPFSGSTSLDFLSKAKIKFGAKVLIYGASGALGTAAVQLAKYFGAEVSGVCSTGNMELVKSIGAHHVFDYTSENFYEKGELYDVIFDTVGKSPFRECVKSLTKEGKYLRAVHISPGNILRGMWVNITTQKQVIGGMCTETADDLKTLASLLENGRYKPVIGQRYKLEDIAKAHEYLDSGHKVGNIAIIIQGGEK